MTVVTADADGGDERWPPGFRFHPTDEELVLYYLKKKICRRKIRLDIIRELDVYKWDPEELPGQSMLKTGDRQWFFFSPRDRKYPNGARSNRATQQGYWKATGKDRIITCNSRNVGVKKTLVFYRGRAPSGERTNWVMHEYTLDEEELKRCPNVKDYFALYKVYKKSGAGPKNGEQYGAPFREEDWADDYPEVNVPFITDRPVRKKNDVVPRDNVEAESQVVPLSDSELDEILKKIADQPLCELHPIGDQNCLMPQVVAEEESQSTLVDPSNRDFSFPEQINLLAPSSQLHDKQANFEFNCSGNSVLHSNEVSEVTSAPENSQQAIQFAEEDFLEMDDLIDQEPTLSADSKPLENLGFDDFDGLSQFDLYHDAHMFLCEMGPVDPEPILHQQLNFIGNEPVNQGGFQLQQHYVADQIGDHFNQGGSQLQQHYVADQIGDHMQPLLSSDHEYQLQPQLYGEGQLVNDQKSNIISSPEPNFGTQPPSGDVSQCMNNSDGLIQNQNTNEDGGATWFSSTLWSFVESIPTTPASAAESPLVNKALERMSSFSRLRMNIKYSNADPGNAATNVRATRRNRSIIFLSIFGALCAILWVFVGSVRVLGRSISW